uniref:RNA binding protein-like n=1 Tax=Oryza sativa subsp. indica TaxID=39946 RepID=C8TF10_ORYSI|nr:RNA binding protein -like [Oryza sativa Indica Group]BAI39876.1 RNA binding protein -like [Oryza sativa Indica Group]
MVYCISRGGGARGPGPWEWGPRGSLMVHGGPGAPGLTPAGAAGPTRQSLPRARATDGWAPRGSRSARPKAATSARPAGGGAPAPLWSPAAAIGTAERRPREGRERGKRGGGPRLTLGRRRRRKRRPERRKAAARLGRTGTAALWWSASSTRGWTGMAAVRRTRRRRRRGGRRSRRAERAGRRLSATEEREGDGASSIPARRWRGKGWKRAKEVRGGFKWGWKGERAAGERWKPAGWSGHHQWRQRDLRWQIRPFE